MLQRVLTVWMFAAATPWASAQHVVKGIVRDSDKRPVPFCNVYTQRDGLPIQLGQTDETGAYQLEQSDTDSCELIVTSVGFKRHVEKIKPGNQALRVDVILEPDTIALDQVIIHAERPIQVRGDTVVYDAIYFAAGNEVALGDLLKKLPGLSVDEQGKVKFRGKDVKKVKVEGDDLFEANYQLLTKNLSADLIEQVEVLQNYSDNPLLKNIEDADDVAINLTLKKDRQKVFFGDMRGGTNFLDRYEARANLVSFLDRAKFYGLGSMNNIGIDPTGDVEQLISSGGQDGHVVGDDVGSEYLVPVAKPLVAEFRRDRYYFNQAAFGSFHGIFKPAKNLSIHVMGSLYYDRTSFTLANITDYYTSADTSSFREESSSLTRDGLAVFHATVKYQVTPRANIAYKARFNQADGSVNQGSNLNQNSVVKQLNSNAGLLDHQINYTQKLTEREAITLDIRFLRDTRPQRLFIDGNLVGGYFPTAPPSDSLSQDNDLVTKFWGSEVNYFRKLADAKLGVRAGYKETEQVLSSMLQSTTAWLSSNNLANRQRERYTEAYFAWRRGNFTLTPAAGYQQMEFHLSDRTAPTIHFLNPRIGVKYKINSRSLVSATYSQGNSTSATAQLKRNPLMLDYNLISVGDDQFRTFARQTYLLNYQLGDLTSRFSLYATVLHQDLGDDYLGNVDVEPNYTVSTTRQLADRTLTSLSVTMDRFFKPFLTNFKVDWRASRSEFTTATEGVRVPTTSNGHTLDISLRSAFPGSLNLHVGHILQATLTRSTLVGASNYSSLFYIDGYVTALKQRLNITLHMERYELISVEGRPTFNFLDLQARFRVRENGTFLLFVNARNLLNETVYAQRSVSPQGIATTVNQLIPRYVLFGLEVRW